MKKLIFFNSDVQSYFQMLEQSENLSSNYLWEQIEDIIALSILSIEEAFTKALTSCCRLRFFEFFLLKEHLFC